MFYFEFDVKFDDRMNSMPFLFETCELWPVLLDLLQTFMPAAVMMMAASASCLRRNLPSFHPLHPHPLHPRLHPPLSSEAPSFLHQTFNLPYFNLLPPNPTQRFQRTPGGQSNFSSPSSSSSSPPSSNSPIKDSLLQSHVMDEPNRTYSFTPEDLFTVLYGYSKDPQQGFGHAISGLMLPSDPGTEFTVIIYSI